MSNDFLTTPQTANYLGLKAGTLEVWRVQGKGPAFVKFGRAVRYRKADLERWIEQQAREHTGRNESELNQVSL